MSRTLLLGQVLTFLLLAQVGLVVWNLRVVRRPAARRSARAPLVSVLVPARNEEASIATCLEALLGQDYPNFEIIVLDDRSTDGTAATALARRDPRVRLVRGAELPDGWTGKNWACAQLAREARGDVLCFVDADTILQPETLSRASGELREGDLGLVSMLLRTDTGTVAEGVLMPMVNYAVLGLLPAALIERPGFPQAAVALGSATDPPSFGPAGTPGSGRSGTASPRTRTAVWTTAPASRSWRCASWRRPCSSRSCASAPPSRRVARSRSRRCRSGSSCRHARSRHTSGAIRCGRSRCTPSP